MAPWPLMKYKRATVIWELTLGHLCNILPYSCRSFYSTCLHSWCYDLFFPPHLFKVFEGWGQCFNFWSAHSCLGSLKATVTDEGMAGGSSHKMWLWQGMPSACCLILFFVVSAHCLLGKDFQDWSIQATDWGGECDRCEYTPVTANLSYFLPCSPDCDPMDRSLASPEMSRTLGLAQALCVPSLVSEPVSIYGFRTEHFLGNAWAHFLYGASPSCFTDSLELSTQVFSPTSHPLFSPKAQQQTILTQRNPHVKLPLWWQAMEGAGDGGGRRRNMNEVEGRPSPGRQLEPRVEKAGV